jgi:hypothetical protein
VKRAAHLLAALVAMATIALFWTSSLAVELFGDADAIAAVKRLIVFPGLLILIPALAATGGSGFALARTRAGALVDAKKRRMPFIALNGLLILVPCALLLHGRASVGSFDAWFHAVQAIELAAGALNLALMALNLRDGLRLHRVQQRLA